MPILHAKLAQALFAPRGIALLGASGDAAKRTARSLRFLRKHGYTRRIRIAEAVFERSFSQRREEH